MDSMVWNGSSWMAPASADQTNHSPPPPAAAAAAAGVGTWEMEAVMEMAAEHANQQAENDSRPLKRKAKEAPADNKKARTDAAAASSSSSSAAQAKHALSLLHPLAKHAGLYTAEIFENMELKGHCPRGMQEVMHIVFEYMNPSATEQMCQPEQSFGERDNDDDLILSPLFLLVIFDVFRKHMVKRKRLEEKELGNLLSAMFLRPPDPLDVIERHGVPQHPTRMYVHLGGLEEFMARKLEQDGVASMREAMLRLLKLEREGK